MSETMKLWAKYRDVNRRIETGGMVHPPHLETPLLSKLAKQIRERSEAEDNEQKEFR